MISVVHEKNISYNYRHMSVLEYIASYDDLIQFCGTNDELGKKHKNVFADKETRLTTFDPYLSAASNPDILKDETEMWLNAKTLKAGSIKRGFFSPEKYTSLFINTMKDHLEDTEKPKLVRSGFDSYAYLMAYEETILNEYKDLNISIIQKACLHYIEIRYDIKPVDYLRYLASYNDLIIAAYQVKKKAADDNVYFHKFAETHYKSKGLKEILSGVRKADVIFNPTKYVATYIHTKDAFTDPITGVINEKSATMAYITHGAANGLQPDLFNPYVFISNYPELVREDIYVKDVTDGEISKQKLSKIWIDKFPHNIDLSKFNVTQYKLDAHLEDDIQAFKINALNKVIEYQKEIRIAASFFVRFFKIFNISCVSKKSKESNFPKTNQI